MPIDCLLPAVRSEMLLLKPAVLATTSKLPPAAAALKGTADVAAGLAPGARDGAALIDHVGCENELVGVARAGQCHGHVGASNRVGGAAAQAFPRTVVERDAAATGPIAR